MNAIRDILELQGELEWARCVGGLEPLRPPFIAWRYKTPDESLENRVVDAIRCYSGAVKWTVRKGERNWVLEPAAFREYAQGFRLDTDALQRFGEEFPLAATAALEDALHLGAHLRRELEVAASSSDAEGSTA